MKFTQQIQNGYEMAKQARQNSYSVYSHFAVGACLKVKNHEQVFTGCNVENSSFGATICAERTSLVKMVSELGGSQKIEWVVIVADTDTPTPPCGLCLQQLSDFVDAETQVYLGDLQALRLQIAFKDLIPYSFHFPPA